MKSAKLFTGLLLGLVMLAAATASAAEKVTVETPQAMTVNGNQLPAGKYTVTWEGSGPGVELKFLKGKNVVATVPAQLVNLKTINSPGLIVTRKDNAGVALTQIQPDGKKYAFTIGGESVQTAAQNSGKQ
jgi:hypothetical protein